MSSFLPPHGGDIMADDDELPYPWFSHLYVKFYSICMFIAVWAIILSILGII